MLDAPPPKVRRKPEVLPRQGEHEVNVSPHGSRNEVTCREEAQGAGSEQAQTRGAAMRRHGPRKKGVCQAMSEGELVSGWRIM